jgi:hypothetical protein
MLVDGVDVRIRLDTLDPKAGSLSLCVNRDVSLWDLRSGDWNCCANKVPEKNLIEITDLGICLGT